MRVEIQFCCKLFVQPDQGRCANRRRRRAGVEPLGKTRIAVVEGDRWIGLGHVIFPKLPGLRLPV